MQLGRIYLIINKENGHKYIGQTTHLVNKRWAEHISEARRMSQTPLHRAIRKYGTHMFMIREICECNVDELNEKEQYYIKQYNTFESSNGYNATSGGERPLLSQETKDKISDTMSDVERTDEWKTHIKESINDRIQEQPWGFHLKENRGNGKHSRMAILAIDVETGREIEYESIRAAAKDIKGDVRYTGNISNAIRNGWKAYGYLWKRLDDKTKSTPVYGVHKKTWEKTQVFKSMKEAARVFGVSDSVIRMSVKNPRRHSCKGYYWYKA